MKKIVLLIIVFFYASQSFVQSLQAQTLYGTTWLGGSEGGGTIQKFDIATNQLIVARSFEDIDASPIADFIQANNGLLYGTTTSSGVGGSAGVIFSIDPLTRVYKRFRVFDDINNFDNINMNGAYPVGSLMQAGDGKLYGTTKLGGSSGLGVIYSFDPSTAEFIKLKDFTGTDGSYPLSKLLQATDGMLYGTTSSGGSSGFGVIYSFDPAAAVFTKLKDFNNTGRNPFGGLMQASDGKLYGLAANGGSLGFGTIFSYDPATLILKKLKDFASTTINGKNPRGSLVQAGDGKLYGLTTNGGLGGVGALFSFDPLSLAYTKLRDFNTDDGATPQGSLIQAANGKLYGMTSAGGSQGYGVIFSFDPFTLAFAKHRDFNFTDGAYPQGGLMQAGDGKLYGLTFTGGGGVFGIAFSFDPLVSTYVILKDFGKNYGGSNVTGSLVKASDGKLYGMTFTGGSGASGVIFSFDPYTSVYTKLNDFDGINGRFPRGSLMQATDGKLYGMTGSGGSNNKGVIFSFDPSSFSYIKLMDFDGVNSGADPLGSLIQAGNGKLYGMTYYGGTKDLGVLFSFDPETLVFKKKVDFLSAANGSRPQGNLLQANDGKLYGVTLSGGIRSSYGVIFSFDPSSSTFQKLFDFQDTNTNGTNPAGSLIQAKDGKLYGMTSDGTIGGNGAIFSFDPASAVYTKLKNFDGINGRRPQGSLKEAHNGSLYGTTGSGGAHGLGVIFSIDPAANNFTKLADYNGTNGAAPGVGSAFIEISDSVANRAPFVALTTPAQGAVYLAGGNVYLNAAASDSDGTISKVEFYNDHTLLYAALDTPYTFKWQDVRSGNYNVIAKATDNSGLTASDTVHISVDRNTPPSVSLINPLHNQTFATPANIHIEAIAADSDGRVTKVEFFNGSTLLALERKIPYTYDWANVAAGIYTITARATDNWGAATTTAPVIIVVTLPGPMVSSRPSALNNKTNVRGTISIQLAPNPAKGTVNIFTTGLQKDKQTILSVIAATGVTIKTIKIAGADQIIPVDVSPLASGVYTIKIINGDKVRYKKLVKL